MNCLRSAVGSPMTHRFDGARAQDSELPGATENSCSNAPPPSGTHDAINESEPTLPPDDVGLVDESAVGLEAVEPPASGTFR